MSDWFVRPDTVRLELTDGHWILVKRALNAGEDRRMLARMTEYDADNRVRMKVEDSGMAQITAYLLDWSIVGLDGEPMPITVKSGARVSIAELEAILDNLEPTRFKEINWAIDRHIGAERQARDAEKKTTRTGATGSPVNSGSLVGAGGAMNGSTT